MYPEQKFNTFADLLAYINTHWVTNGVGDITGVVGNNVVNGLLTFLTQSPYNSKLAAVSNSSGGLSLSSPITIIVGNPPSSIYFGDNIYNQWSVINWTGTNIALNNSCSYRDYLGNIATYFPAQQAVHLAKSTNGLWAQVNNPPSTGGGGGNTTFTKIVTIVDADSPNILTNGQVSYTIYGVGILQDSLDLIIDNSILIPNITEQISYNVIYTPNFVTVQLFNYSIDDPTVNLGFQKGMKVYIKYASSY